MPLFYMKLKIPYYRQKSDYLCGPTVLQMVFSFFNKHKTEAELLHDLGLTTEQLKESGIENDLMIRPAQRAGLYCYVNEGSSFAELQYFIQLGSPIIINYIEPKDEEGHFAVVVGYNSVFRTIILNDPYNGRHFRISEKQLNKRWMSLFDKRQKHRWMMAVSPKPFSIGKQFNPIIKKKKVSSGK